MADEEEPLPIHIIHDFRSSKRGMEMWLRWQKCLFVITMARSDVSAEPLTLYYFDRATDLAFTEPGQERDDALPQLKRHILQQCNPFIREFAATAPAHPAGASALPRSGTIEAIFHPITFEVRLFNVVSPPEVVKLQAAVNTVWYLNKQDWLSHTEFAVFPRERIDPCDLPIAVPKQIFVLQSIHYDLVHVVLWWNTTYVFKAARRGYTYGLSGEIEKYEKLNELKEQRAKNAVESETLPPLRIPRCHGIAIHYDHVIGLLLQYIPETIPLSSARCLNAPLERRKKWRKQIRDMVEELHENDIVWGDVKTDNVLVDDNDDAWLIDFGGGTTQGWVDADKVDSVEGDLQGLKRIEEALRL